MYMSDRELLGRFERADDKKEIVKILAELNAVAHVTMLDKLGSLGITMEEIMGTGKRRGRPKGSKNLKTVEPKKEEKKVKKQKIEEKNTEEMSLSENVIEAPTKEELPMVVRIAVMNEIERTKEKMKALGCAVQELEDFLQRR